MTNHVTRASQIAAFNARFRKGERAVVTFRKKDGTLRRMVCVSGDHAPADALAAIKGAPQSPAQMAYVKVWDLEAQGWRQFHPDSLLRASVGPARWKFRRD